MNLENKVIGILSNILGNPKRDYCSSNGWIEFNCPVCAEQNGGPDNKYNLAVSIDVESDNSFYCHCWRCLYAGKISKLIKQYGSPNDYIEYKEELNAYRQQHLYTLSNGINNDFVNTIDDIEVELPKGFKLISNDDFYANDSINYLYNRGLTDDIIKKYNIGYVGNYKGKYSQRIVIPSYDIYGELNYWIARDYTGYNKWKILNPDIDKKQIIFNEQFINWYEPITLVEGPFDHIVVPNSIPLLGKNLDENSLIYKRLIVNAKNDINIFLDKDAIDSSYKLYKKLNHVLPNRVKIIESPSDDDASDYYKLYGYKGIIQLMKTAYKLDDYTLTMI